MLPSIDSIDLSLVTGGAGADDLCSQAMVAHLTGKTPSPEGVQACASQGITFGTTPVKDLPQLPTPKATPSTTPR